MKIIYLSLSILPVFFICTRSLAQYNNITIERNDLPEAKIIQVDQYANSTVIHFTFRNIAFERFSGSEKITLVENGTNRIANLLNSYNLPLSPRMHVFGDGVETLNFSLEFEKIKLEQGFDIQGPVGSDFNLYNVTIDQNQTATLLAIDEFVSKTPSKEYYVFYHEDYPVLRYAYKGIVVAVKLIKDRNYGIHFQPNFLIQNYTDKDILFDPQLVIGQWKVEDKYYKAPIIAYRSYIKHVKKIQRRREFGVALSEAFAALPAGFASINTTSNAYATAYGMSTGYGYIGSVPIGATSNVSASASAVGQSSTSIYNGAAAYAASQQARANTDNFRFQQVQQLEKLSTGYAKKNTIPPSTEYEAFLNIPFGRNAETLYIQFTIGEQEFLFEWDTDQLAEL